MALPLTGRRKHLWVFGPALLGLLVDQITKQAVRTQLDLGQVIPVAPGFAITHVINKGGAFSLLYGNVWFLAAVSTAVALGLIVYAVRRPTMPAWQAVGLGILLGGTVGNLVDRLAFGRVTDFLDVSVGTYHWPTFNVADVCINVGVGMLVFLSMLWPDPRPPMEESSR